eukprot:2528080-Rhodomonas_salina.2
MGLPGGGARDLFPHAHRQIQGAVPLPARRNQTQATTFLVQTVLRFWVLGFDFGVCCPIRSLDHVRSHAMPTELRTSVRSGPATLTLARARAGGQLRADADHSPHARARRRVPGVGREQERARRARPRWSASVYAGSASIYADESAAATNGSAPRGDVEGDLWQGAESPR